MSMLAPEGPVYQAGTLSGNPVATTAGLATLRLRRRRRLRAPRPTPRRLVREAAGAALAEAGVPHVVQHAGNMFSVFFTDDGVTEVPDFAAARAQHPERYTAFFHAMLDQGVYLPPSAFEAWFVSAAHDDDAWTAIAAALPRAASAAAARRRRTQPSEGAPMTRPDHRAPAAPRRGAQPGRDPLRPAARLPPLRRRPQMAERRRDRRSATATSPHVVASPLERAQETAAPAAAARGLDIVTDARVIEADNIFEGRRFGVGDGVAAQARSTGGTCGTRSRPSWGEPYQDGRRTG